MKKRISLVILGCLISTLSYSKVLMLKDVIASTEKYLPEILEAQRNVDVKSAQLGVAKGAFDTRLIGSYYDRVDGYYDTRSFDLKVEKPLSFFNSKLYGGLRRGEGNIPVYESQLETLSEGEYYLGIELSLLKDALKDKRRANLNKKIIDLENERNNLVIKRKKIKATAELTYWSWVSKGYILQSQRELLEMLEKRRKGLRVRVRNGDIASIYLVETDQYILKRKNEILNAQKNFAEAGFKLSRYSRAQDGNVSKLNISVLPEVSVLEGIKPLTEKELSFQKGFIADISNKIRKNEIEVQLNRNNLLPKLNLKASYAEDAGMGNNKVFTEEAKLGLSLEIPIERRQVRNSLRRSKAKQKALRYKKQSIVEKLTNRVETHKRNIEILKGIITNSKEEIDLHLKLIRAEKEKIKNGQSDFFVLNIRENSYIDSRLKYLKSLFIYKRNMVALSLLTSD